MIDQQTASIIKYILDASGNPFPYYHKVPQNFKIPAVYFPTPEILSGGDTFGTYYLDYALYIVFFASSDVEAYGLGFRALDAIRAARNMLPLLDESGAAIDGEYIRVKDPRLKVIDTGAAQLVIEWRDRKPYADTTVEYPEVSGSWVNFLPKSEELTDTDAETILTQALQTLREENSNE